MNLAVTQRLDRLVRSHISHRTLQQGFVLLVASTIGNVLQYIFHAYVSRVLGPAEYGVFTALLALYVIVSVPTGIAQTVVAQYVARLRALNESSQVSGLLISSLKYLSLAGVVVFGLVVAASTLIASFLNVPSELPVIAMASIFLVAGGSTAVAGALQGLQRFYALAANGFLGPLIRLIGGVVLIVFGWGAVGALGASTISAVLVVVLGLFFLRDVLRGNGVPPNLGLSAVSWYTGVVLLGTLAFTILTNIDLIVVKHFFSPEEAGYYSAASVLGKIILFFPGTVSTVMFPKTAQRFALGQDASDIVRKSVLVTVGLCGLAAAMLDLFPSLAVHLLFGNQYDGSISLVSLYGVTMGLYALVQLLMTFYISQEEARFIWLLGGVSTILAIVLALYHVTLVQVILSLAAGATGILVISELWLGGLGLVPKSRD